MNSRTAPLVTRGFAEGGAQTFPFRNAGAFPLSNYININPLSGLFYQLQLSLKPPAPTADSDRTVSRRSKHSSRATLIGEQPNPWEMLHPQDVTSRHRGAKQPRRYGLLGVISLLSPAYLLSVERWPTHAGPPDHYDRLSSLLDVSVSQSSGLMPLHATSDFRPL